MSIGSIYSIIFDPPMLHMRFDRENHPEYPELLNLHATGKDGIGAGYGYGELEKMLRAPRPERSNVSYRDQFDLTRYAILMLLYKSLEQIILI